MVPKRARSIAELCKWRQMDKFTCSVNQQNSANSNSVTRSVRYLELKPIPLALVSLVSSSQRGFYCTFLFLFLEMTTEPVTRQTKVTNTKSITGLPTTQTLSVIYSRGKPIYTSSEGYMQIITTLLQPTSLISTSASNYMHFFIFFLRAPTWVSIFFFSSPTLYNCNREDDHSSLSARTQDQVVPTPKCILGGMEKENQGKIHKFL